MKSLTKLMFITTILNEATSAEIFKTEQPCSKREDCRKNMLCDLNEEGQGLCRFARRGERCGQIGDELHPKCDRGMRCEDNMCFTVKQEIGEMCE